MFYHAKVRWIAVLGIVIATSLLTASAALGKLVYRWQGPKMIINRICMDGVRFGAASNQMGNYNGVDKSVDMRFDFLTDIPEDDSIEPGKIIGQARGVTFDLRNIGFSPWCQYQEQQKQVLNSDQFCKSDILATWPTGTVNLNDIIAVRWYLPNKSNPVNDADYELMEDLTDRLDQPDDPKVSNCSVYDTPTINLVQTGKDATPPLVTDKLVFRVNAYDPDWDPKDGAGIQQVDMQILGPSGAIRQQIVEKHAGFCAFGGDGPCTAWNFASHGNKWPNGMAIENGNHTLQAVVRTLDGTTKTFTATVQIQLPQAPTVTSTATGTATSTATATPTATSTATSTGTATPTGTATATATPIASDTPTFTPTATQTPIPTILASPPVTPISIATNTPTATSTSVAGQNSDAPVYLPFVIR